MRPSIYVIYAGGTVGMRLGAGGWEPAPGLLPELMHAMPELQGADVPRFTIHEFPRLLDSSNMTPEDWNAIGRDLADHYEAYDGFVVLHGTDTMAYTASALSFMLEGLGKPVVLTGSQIPLCETRNDARSNLLNALLIAGMPDVPEVTLCFGRQLMRANRVVKLHVGGLDAFATPNFPPLGDLGIAIEIHHERVRAPDPVAFRLRPCSTGLVAALRLFPGITGAVLASVLRPPLRGLVLEAYGSGNAPTSDREFLGAVAEATTRGVVVVVVTQCLFGAVDIGAYAAGSALAGAAVVGGHDMTIEAAVCKLLYLLGQSEDPRWVRAEMGRDLRGELTVAPA
jgi:L-asparaginase